MQLLETIFDVPFGILNIAGLMDIQDIVSNDATHTHTGILLNPIIAHPTFPITLTFDPKYNKEYGILRYKPGLELDDTLYEGLSYQKIYRKNVRWDFGDGTEVEGYSATHVYSYPGKYTISCIFYDVNRQGVQNGYKVNVIVKEAIPTQLSFVDPTEEIQNIPCSSIAKIATVEALLSMNVTAPISIIAERIYDKEDFHEPTWNDVRTKKYPHLERYNCFLREYNEYYNNTDVDIYSQQLVPTTEYYPNYESMWGYYSVKDKNIVFNCYRVIPYASAEQMSPLSYLDPNKSIQETDNFLTCEVTNVSSRDELPKQAVYSGRRAFQQIYYRSDYISENAKVFIHFHQNIILKSGIASSADYINIPPLGLHFNIIANDLTKVSFSATLNGFLTSYSLVDKLVELSMIRDFSFTGKLIPYILSEYNGYYIPKDLDFDLLSVKTTLENDNDSQLDVLDVEIPYYRDVHFTLKNILHGQIVIAKTAASQTIKDLTIIFNFPLKDFDRMIIPTEHYYNQDVNRLLDAYTPHPLFKETPVLKNALYDVLTHNDILNYLVTRGIHFFDDTTHIDTCYVSYLLSRLQMMGQDIYEYSSNFEGVNELRDLARILTMNHSELVGNYIDNEYDIKINESHKGENVGEEIYVTDKLYVVMSNQVVGDTRFQKGKIVKFEREGKTYTLKEPTVLIVRDNYTNETRTVSFSDLTPRNIEEGYGLFYIQDYTEEWPWGLLFPEELDVKSNGLSALQLKEKSKVMTSYYTFYLLNTDVNKHYVSNFLEETTITPQVENLASWMEEDGHTFDLVQKVVYEKGDMMDK